MEKTSMLSMRGRSGLWALAWLFTVGFAHLSFWKAILAIVMWPYYFGWALSGVR